MSYPTMRPLTPAILEAIELHPVHMCSLATTYNNMTCFGATCVCNNNDVGGFEKDFRGDHAVTIKGHLYHTTHDQKSSNPSSGLGVMFFEHKKEHAVALLNAENDRRGTGEPILMSESSVSARCT